ncbi:MAG: hypothetical protein IJX11_01905 [Bacteroidales bacterium]|nr:hypothetical protein [Bacteroidales bacterium]
MLPKFLRRRREKRPSLRRKIFLALGAIAAILLLSSVISIMEYRRMSSYVSELIASNIKSINLSQSLADLTQEYNHQMVSVVVQNDISLMPEFNQKMFRFQSDSLRRLLNSQASLPLVDSLDASFDAFMNTSLMFDAVFLADSVDTGEWFFGTLQPCYNTLRADIASLNEQIHEDLKENSEDFDAGFYRSIMPGFVSICAGLLLVILLLYFLMVDYVRPIYKVSEGIDNYRALGRRHGYTFDGDDQLANINSGVTELIEENIELKRRVKNLREDREKMLQTISERKVR